MKKVLFVIALLMGLTTIPADAKTAPVQTLQDFSIAKPSQTLLIKILSNVQLNKNLMLHEGYYVLGLIMDVSNSTFVIILLHSFNSVMSYAPEPQVHPSFSINLNLIPLSNCKVSSSTLFML